MTFLSLFAVQVWCTPSFFSVFSSTEDSSTEQCTSQSRSLPSCSSAKAALGSVTAHMDRAISTSSVCSRGLRLPRWRVFSAWMGRITCGEISNVSSGIPPRCFKALSSIALAQPSSSVVLPVIKSPFSSSMAAQGVPVFAAVRVAAAAQARSSVFSPA